MNWLYENIYYIVNTNLPNHTAIMNRTLKIVGWCLLVIIIAFVCYLMFGWKNPANINTEEPIAPDVIIENKEEIEPENTTDINNPEEDIMNDLESFFNGWNGYEDVEWDFWFIDPNAE